MITILVVSVILTPFTILPAALAVFVAGIVLESALEVRLDFWPTTIAFAYLVALVLSIIGHVKAKKAANERPSTGKVIDHE